MKIKNRNMKFIEVEAAYYEKLSISINHIQAVKVDERNRLIISTYDEDYILRPGTHTYESLLKAIIEL